MSFSEGANDNLSSIDSLMESLRISVSESEHDASSTIECECGGSSSSQTSSKYSKIFGRHRRYIDSEDLSVLFNKSLYIRGSSSSQNAIISAKRINQWRKFVTAKPVTSTPISEVPSPSAAIINTSGSFGVPGTSGVAGVFPSTSSTDSTSFEDSLTGRVMPLIRKSKLCHHATKKDISKKAGGSDDNDQSTSSSSSKRKEDYRDIYALTRKYLHNCDQMKAKRRRPSRKCIRI